MPSAHRERSAWRCAGRARRRRTTRREAAARGHRRARRSRHPPRARPRPGRSRRPPAPPQPARVARQILRQAVDTAHHLGASALARRAETELRATGARPRRVQLSGLEALTASERRIAELTADGFTNRQIAQLCLSPPGRSRATSPTSSTNSTSRPAPNYRPPWHRPPTQPAPNPIWRARRSKSGGDQGPPTCEDGPRDQIMTCPPNQNTTATPHQPSPVKDRNELPTRPALPPLPPQYVGPDTWLVRQVQEAKGAPLSVYINSLIITGTEPVIVDTGSAANRDNGWRIPSASSTPPMSAGCSSPTTTRTTPATWRRS